MYRACFDLWIKKRVIFMRSALLLVHGLKNESYSCVARSVLVHRLRTLRNELYSVCSALMFWFMD